MTDLVHLPPKWTWKGEIILKKTVNYQGDSFTVDLSGDFYGESYWDAFQNGYYEPDTINFLERNLNKNCVFLDIGAANGGMTLVGAMLNASVLSFEPNPHMFEVTRKNVALNSAMIKNVKVYNQAVSTSSGTIRFGTGSNSRILSDIVFSGDSSSDAVVEVVALSKILADISSATLTNKIVIKKDIEGAEWNILNHSDTLKSLKSQKVILLLAVHPGFYRPHKKRVRGLDRFLLAYFHLLNFRESKRTFENLRNYAKVFRTNLNEITSAKQFAFLIFAGYHEFIVQF